jgi:hypothetical protein
VQQLALELPQLLLERGQPVAGVARARVGHRAGRLATCPV